ncbi:MAG: hypothetical protein ACREMB_15410, partial [Candidatus Rokuibacteriota bacterium]
MGPTPVADAGVDVARVMEEIRERVRERRASGFYSDEEVRRIAKMELEVTDVVPGFRDEIEHHLAVLNDGWDTAQDPEITSHRRAVGALIVGLKTVLRRLTRPYINLVLTRQVDFNSRLLHLLNAFIPPVTEISRKLGDLTLDVHERLSVAHGEAVQRHRELAQRLDALAGELAAVRAA